MALAYAAMQSASGTECAMTIMGQINVRSRTGILSGQPTRKLSLEGAVPSFKGDRETVRVNNLSRTGMLLETGAPLSIGEPLQILLPEGDYCSAIVVWANEFLFACEFERTLSTATISRIRLQGPKSELPDGRDDRLAPETGNVCIEETLGNRLKRLRRERGFSMVHFASRVGVSKPTLWKWEKGTVFPRQDMIGVIARALGVSEKELIYGNGPQGEQRAGASAPVMGTVQDAIVAKKAELAQIMGVTPDRIRILVEA